MICQRSFTMADAGARGSRSVLLRTGTCCKGVSRFCSTASFSRHQPSRLMTATNLIIDTISNQLWQVQPGQDIFQDVHCCRQATKDFRPGDQVEGGALRSVIAT